MRTAPTRSHPLAPVGCTHTCRAAAAGAPAGDTPAQPAPAPAPAPPEPSAAKSVGPKEVVVATDASIDALLSAHSLVLVDMYGACTCAQLCVDGTAALG